MAFVMIFPPSHSFLLFICSGWYFATVLLTTVGYGDIVPVTHGGKLFATVYILVAGSILLDNMSHIAAIPLELRKRRIESAVLTQFGDLLDDDALRELASGPLIQRIHLSAKRADGLDECTRGMFAIAMLVRLGKVTEDDILETFNAFNRLDVNREGVLNSRSIIAGMINRSRSKANLAGFKAGGMRKVSSSQNMRTPFQPPLPAVDGGQNRIYDGDAASANPFSIPQAPGGYGYDNRSSNPARIPTSRASNGTTERSALLQNDANYSMLSRSG